MELWENRSMYLGTIFSKPLLAMRITVKSADQSHRWVLTSKQNKHNNAWDKESHLLIAKNDVSSITCNNT